ncbi:MULTISPECIES: glucosyltransferase domain-containing protein [Pantoea]|uniref:Glucosyl transferase GtrII family protein n=2 Tax=Pantoea TaxID=53335 RepID=A0A0U3TDF8_9GAMM|nr:MULTISPECIES: glucosyltransferase domain-containing protein [Pantoea]ALV91768.1 hypothetical protein LK04_06235 [Pantoea vagans]KHJ69763.1 hypothetical protein QU24_02010 [Pantoea rodasii]
MSLCKSIDFNHEKLNTFKYAFFAAFISYCVMYGFELTHFTLSIDEDFFDNYHHTIELGRWGHAIIRKYILPEPFAPFFTMALSIVITSIATALAGTYLFEQKHKSICFSIICASIPLLAYQFQFQNQADTLSISILLATLMAMVFDGELKWIIKSLAFIVMGIMSMSIYQSIILMPVALILSRELINSMNGNSSLKNGLKKILFLLSLIISVYAFYSIATHLVQRITHIPPTSYLTDMASWGKDSSSNVLKGIFTHLKWRLANKSHFGLGIYWITICSIIAVIAHAISRKNIYPVLVVICVYLFPFSLDIITGSWLPARTLTQMPICFAALVVITFFDVERTFLYAVSLTLLCIGSANSNRMFYADYVTNQQDTQLSQMMLSDLFRQYPTFSARRDKIYFYGNDPLNNKWKPNNSENFGMSFFQYGDSRIVQYINMTSFLSLQRVDDRIIKENHAKIENMPCWPQNGSIMRDNNNYIIKYCSTSF